MEVLSSLNPQQVEAVKNTEGPLLVLAGAGSGKTRVITVRIAYLIAEKGVPPHNILAVTFTNKAAGEMRGRVEALLKGKKLDSRPLVSTFHSLCVRILRQDIERLGEGYTRSFTIYDTDDSQRVLKAVLRDLGIDEKQLQARVVRASISAAKNRGEDAEMFGARAERSDEKRAIMARAFQMYDERLAAANALDFDDLLIKTVRLLGRVAEVREKYNDRYRYILVDEYQDTNALQFAMIRHLTEKQENICVVGDDAQSIYGFRQADIRNILEFEQHYPNARAILLEQNYRSTQTILDAAHALIEKNVKQKKKKLWTSNPGGERLMYFQAPDSEDEARFVASRIEDHMGRDASERIAVLYRTNAQSRLFEEALRRRRIDYNIVGGFSFYERAEIKDIVAYLKLVMNPRDNIALLRVLNTPPRGIGKTSQDELQGKATELGVTLWEAIGRLTDGQARESSTLGPRAIAALAGFKRVIEGLQAKFEEAVAAERPVSDLVIAAIEDTGYGTMLRTEDSDESAGRLENLEELVNAAVEYDTADGSPLRDFVDHAALTSDTDNYDRNARVTLMTVHSAKGLEFPIVFIAGLEDGVFPHSRSINDPDELEEERRLAYVAITRAERLLYVTHSMRRRVYGEFLASEPSQFLNELPLDSIEDLSRGPSWLSFARGGAAMSRTEDASPAGKPRSGNVYTGKTYNTVEAVTEFFRNRGQKPAVARTLSADERPAAAPVDPKKPSASPPPAAPGGFLPGSHVRHEKYGRGLVLRREGSGDNVKLTVSFPGFGQKKLIEKFAHLEQA